MKKVVYSIFLILIISLIAGCTNKVTIEGNQNLSLKEGDTLTLDLTTTDQKGLSFSSLNESVVTVSEDGTITAVSVGDAVIVAQSKSNKDVQLLIAINVTKKVNLTATESDIIVTKGTEHEIVFTSNDDVTFSSSSEAIFTVNAQGVVTGVETGDGILTITSVTDPTVKVMINITVRKVVYLTVTSFTQELIVGEQGSIFVSSNDQYTFTSGNTAILTVNAQGRVTPVSAGETTVTIQSTYDDTIHEEITIKVYSMINTLSIVGDTNYNVYQEARLEANIAPLSAYQKVTWTSSNHDVLTINQEGVLTLISAGQVDVTATSTVTPSKTQTVTITVLNQLIVDQTKTAGSIEHEGVTYTLGQGLHATLQNALMKAIPGANILVKDGVYEENITIDQDNLTLRGIGDVTYKGDILLSADGITISDLKMEGNTSITSSKVLDGLTLNRIQAEIITKDFITIQGTKGNLVISNNTISGVTGHAIKISAYESGEMLVQKNTITHVTQAIQILPGESHLDTTVIKVERNEINQVSQGIEIQTKTTIHAYARFNSVMGATGYLAKSNSGSGVEFTLNHWGSATLDMTKFDQIEQNMLLGHYPLKSDIMTEAKYNPTLPVKIVITNPIEEMRIDDQYQFTFAVLPYDFQTDFIRWITSAPEVMTISREGIVTPLRSGNVTLTVRSTIDTSISSTVTVMVLTDPGIELKPVNVNNHNIVGTTLSLSATPFPANIKNTPVSFTSSDDAIASVNNDGLVTLHTPGVVTITAGLIDHPTVTNTFTFEVYQELDDSNLLDLLTKTMVTYTTPHRWTAVGMSFSYDDFKYESVSKYYFGDYTINQSKMVPVSNGIRPGEGMTAHPLGITQYNPYNVYWVVVHDTANTAPGAGALSHANYLYSSAMSGVVLNTSWHFTIDDKALYQHLPETERGYHAGDGSVLPGQSSTYLGGGNRNGIGIEMGVNFDSDVYRTWQRTAKLGTDLLVKYNLPLQHMRYHVDYSGKNCPQTMRNAGLVPLFEEMKSYEYQISKNFSDADISFVSDNPEYVDHTGRVIKMPDRAMTVSFTVTVTQGSMTTSRTFYSYLPGTIV